MFPSNLLLVRVQVVHWKAYEPFEQGTVSALAGIEALYSGSSECNLILFGDFPSVENFDQKTDISGFVLCQLRAGFSYCIRIGSGNSHVQKEYPSSHDCCGQLMFVLNCALLKINNRHKRHLRITQEESWSLDPFHFYWSKSRYCKIFSFQQSFSLLSGVPDRAARLKTRSAGWNRAGWELNTDWNVS